MQLTQANETFREDDAQPSGLRNMAPSAGKCSLGAIVLADRQPGSHADRECGPVARRGFAIMASAEVKVRAANRLLAEACCMGLVVGELARPHPARHASSGVAAAVIACSQPQAKKSELLV
ncbi:hypothetical protein NDU88_010311 [Pleurodeles waltl]|uniref:Uncharacterized protein n=1 Tax=Pleurodeles waltl TaxID=8319 RepID=A0AAV7PXJ6_PLEWA|nr:hypothetical protein NDU88_010311 [Pleurodeles waltl]